MFVGWVGGCCCERFETWEACVFLNWYSFWLGLGALTIPALIAYLLRSSSTELTLLSPIYYIFLIFFTWSLMKPAKFGILLFNGLLLSTYILSSNNLFLGLWGWLCTLLADLVICNPEADTLVLSLNWAVGYNKLDASWMKKLFILLLLLLIYPMYEIWSDLAKPYLPAAFSSLRLVILSMNLLFWLFVFIGGFYFSLGATSSGYLLNSLIRLVGSNWLETPISVFSRLFGFSCSAFGTMMCFYTLCASFAFSLISLLP